MKLSRERQFFIFVMSILIIAGLAFLLLNEKGYKKYHTLRKEVDSLNTVIKTLETENTLLSNSIDSLERRVHSKINRLARERHNMKAPNETVISVEEK